jgi:hypothetical protein
VVSTDNINKHVIHEQRPVGRFWWVVFRLLRNVSCAVFGKDAGIALLEYAASCVRPLTQVYCQTRAAVVQAEFDYFASLPGAGPDQFERIVMVGGGAVPVTAIYWACHCRRPIVVLEKVRLTTWFCRRLLRRMKLQNVEVRQINGEDYDGYGACIALVSLYATNKAAIVQKILTSGPGKKAIAMRMRPGEDFQSDSDQWLPIVEYDQFRVIGLFQENS